MRHISGASLTQEHVLSFLPEVCHDTEHHCECYHRQQSKATPEPHKVKKRKKDTKLVLQHTQWCMMSTVRSDLPRLGKLL